MNTRPGGHVAPTVVHSAPPQVVYAPPPQVVYVESAPRVVYVPAPPPRVVYAAPPVIRFGFSYHSGPRYPVHSRAYHHRGPGRR